MIAGKDVTVLLYDNAAARPFFHVILRPCVGGYGFRNYGNHARIHLVHYAVVWQGFALFGKGVVCRPVTAFGKVVCI